MQAPQQCLWLVGDPNPIIFFEPKRLYRASVADVPDGDFTLPLGVAEVMQTGSDVTVVGYGAQMQPLQKACDKAAADGISCELIDLQTILPWDIETIQTSVEKTGRLVISHEVVARLSAVRSHAESPTRRRL